MILSFPNPSMSTLFPRSFLPKEKKKRRRKRTSLLHLATSPSYSVTVVTLGHWELWCVVQYIFLSKQFYLSKWVFGLLQDLWFLLHHQNWTLTKTPLVYSAVMVLQDWSLQGLKKVMGGVVLEGTNSQCWMRTSWVVTELVSSGLCQFPAPSGEGQGQLSHTGPLVLASSKWWIWSQYPCTHAFGASSPMPPSPGLLTWTCHQDQLSCRMRDQLS